MADVRQEQQAKAALVAVFPCVCEISRPDHVWCRGGGGDPILVGMTVKEGVLKRGTPLCVERKGVRDEKTGLQAYLDIGRVTTLEKDRKPVDEAKQGQSVSVKIDAVTSIAHAPVRLHVPAVPRVFVVDRRARPSRRTSTRSGSCCSRRSGSG